MPRLKTGYKPQQAQLPNEPESAGEIKVQKLGVLLDQCSREGILDHQSRLSLNDCLFCPFKKLCGEVWGECVEYSQGLEYDEAKAKLEEVFAQKREFVSGNGHKPAEQRGRIITQVAKLWRHGATQFTYCQIAEQLGVSLRTVTRCVAILKKENGNGK